MDCICTGQHITSLVWLARPTNAGAPTAFITRYFSFSFTDKGYIVPFHVKLRLILLLCLPAVLPFPRPVGQGRKEEDRTEGTDDGEVDKEEEEEEEGDELEDKEFSPPDHIAGAPLERDGHLNTVSVCLRAFMYVICACCACNV